MQGKIIKIISNDYTVNSNNKNYVCKSRGKFRNLNMTPLVGDNVMFDEKKLYIMDILDRSNELIRPPMANIDQAIVITSVKDPDFSSNLLDKMLNIIEYNNVKPIICFTKLDLVKQDYMNEIINYYKKIGYDVYLNTEIDKLKTIFKNKITVFTGQTGAGKSTLLNKLDKNLNLKTDEISYALGRGKHTTRYIELLNILDGLVADTPGFSALDFIGMKNENIRDNFIEFRNYTCKYSDCMHNKETDCEVKKAVENNEILKSRYENYLKFISR